MFLNKYMNERINKHSLTWHWILGSIWLMFEPSVASDYLTVEEEQGLPHGERALLLGSPNRIHIDILVSPCSSFCGVIGSCSDGFISLSSEFALLPSSAELGASLLLQHAVSRWACFLLQEQGCSCKHNSEKWPQCRQAEEDTQEHAMRAL